MAKKKIAEPEVQEEIKTVQETAPTRKTINDLTDRERELRYYILKLGVAYGRDKLKTVLGVLNDEMEEGA